MSHLSLFYSVRKCPILCTKCVVNYFLQIPNTGYIGFPTSAQALGKLGIPACQESVALQKYKWNK